MMSLILAAATVAQAGGTTKGQWPEYSPAKGRFTVSLPAKPTEKKRLVAVGGKTVDLTVATSRKGVATYSASFADLQGADPDAALKAGKADLLDQLKGEITEEKPATLGDAPGLELAVEIPRKVVAGGANARARLYAIDGRLYVLSASAPSSRFDAQSEDLDKFFDSFRLEGAEGAMAAAPGAKAPAGGPSSPSRKDSPRTGLGPLAALNPFANRGTGAPPAASPAMPPASARPATAPPGPDWMTFTTPDRKYSILMPGEPKEIKMNAPTPNGPLEVKMYAVEQPNRPAYLSAGTDLPAGALDIEGALEGSKQGMLRSIPGAKLLSEKKIVFDGHRGRDLTIEIPPPRLPNGGTIRVRAVIIGRRLYQLQCIEPKGVIPATDEEVESFHNSLKVLD